MNLIYEWVCLVQCKKFIILYTYYFNLYFKLILGKIFLVLLEILYNCRPALVRDITPNEVICTLSRDSLLSFSPCLSSNSHISLHNEWMRA